MGWELIRNTSLRRGKSGLDLLRMRTPPSRAPNRPVIDGCQLRRVLPEIPVLQSTSAHEQQYRWTREQDERWQLALSDLPTVRSFGASGYRTTCETSDSPTCKTASESCRISRGRRANPRWRRISPPEVGAALCASAEIVPRWFPSFAPL